MLFQDFYYRQMMYRFDQITEQDTELRIFIQELVKTVTEQHFSASSFNTFSVSVLLRYIKSSHHYYLYRRLPEIEQTITQLSRLYPSAHPILYLLQHRFFAYTKHLQEHIQEEETGLLPYIEWIDQQHLIHSQTSFPAGKNLSLHHFIEEHSDTEHDLSELRTIIRGYHPPFSNASLYRILLSQLANFEEDLKLHAWIEDEILLPKAIALEEKIKLLA